MHVIGASAPLVLKAVSSAQLAVPLKAVVPIRRVIRVRVAPSMAVKSPAATILVVELEPSDVVWTSRLRTVPLAVGVNEVTNAPVVLLRAARLGCDTPPIRLNEPPT